MTESKKYVILIVDDSIQSATVLSNILKPLYTTRIAVDGNTAVKMAEAIKPDLILLDIIMPGMSGFDVLIKLKNSDVTKSIPVIFITCLERSENEEKGLMLGAVDYITKPYHNSIVKLRVRTHLQIIEQIRKIERLGMIDVLTDLPNRRCFDHHSNVEWGRAIREKTFISLLMIDIDLFKQINDTYGHAHGDSVLKAVAAAISKALKRPTDLAARWGGEEFAVLLPDTNLKGAIKISERIHANIKRLNIPCSGDITTSVTVSIGIYCEKPDKDSLFKAFILKADKALYLAKSAGRDCYKAYTPDLFIVNQYIEFTNDITFD